MLQLPIPMSLCQHNCHSLYNRCFSCHSWLFFINIIFQAHLGSGASCQWLSWLSEKSSCTKPTLGQNRQQCYSPTWDKNFGFTPLGQRVVNGGLLGFTKVYKIVGILVSQYPPGQTLKNHGVPLNGIAQWNHSIYLSN